MLTLEIECGCLSLQCKEETIALLLIKLHCICKSCPLEIWKTQTPLQINVGALLYSLCIFDVKCEDLQFLIIFFYILERYQ